MSPISLTRGHTHTLPFYKKEVKTQGLFLFMKSLEKPSFTYTSLEQIQKQNLKKKKKTRNLSVNP